MTGDSQTRPRDGDDGEEATSLVDAVQSLIRELPGLVSDRVELFALELARAGSALARIVAWVVAIAILGVTAWLALWAGLVLALISLGLHWAVALLPVLVINLLAVVFAVGQVRQLATRLSLPATRRHLTMSSRPAFPPQDVQPEDHHGPSAQP